MLFFSVQSFTIKDENNLQNNTEVNYQYLMTNYVALIFSYLFPLNIKVIKIPNCTLFWVMPNFTTLTQTIFLSISSVKLSRNINHLHCALTISKINQDLNVMVPKSK